ncbi:unnamed protein product, partial [Mesorhabditis spiculigera]
MGKKSLALDETMDTTVNEEAGAPVTDKDAYEEQCALANEIASPMASRKLAKKVYKLVKKASAVKTAVRFGISDVSKGLRKNEKGIVVLAGNVTPIDIYSHVPAFCEEKGVPYVYTPSRESLGLAAGFRRSIIILLIRPNAAYQELYDELFEACNLLVPNTKEN